MNRNKEIYAAFAQHFQSLADDKHRYYVEGERQTIGDFLNTFEFRCNVSPCEESSEIDYTIDVCIYCESIDTNIYAVQDMFDLVAPLFENFSIPAGCAVRDSGIINKFFGRAGITTPVCIGTSEAVFHIITTKDS